MCVCAFCVCVFMCVCTFCVCVCAEEDQDMNETLSQKTIMLNTSQEVDRYSSSAVAMNFRSV